MRKFLYIKFLLSSLAVLRRIIRVMTDQHFFCIASPQNISLLTFTMSPISLQLIVPLTFAFVMIGSHVNTLVLTSTIQDGARIQSFKEDTEP